MSPSPRPPTTPDGSVVARLRAAGCVFAEDEARLLLAAATMPADLNAMVERRVSGEPLEQILGWAQFCGLRIAVEPGVFVPRRRTELLVEQALGLALEAGDGVGRRDAVRPTVVVDLCCGSGAVGAALLAALDGAEVHAADIDPAAVRCARRNIPTDRGQVHEGDLYEPLPAHLRGRVDLLVVNAPYVPTESIALMPAEARLHEARVALDGGADGLDVQRRVAAGAGQWLAPAGHLLMETSERQLPETVAAFVAAGLEPRVVRSARIGATVVVGSRALTRRSCAPASGTRPS